MGSKDSQSLTGPETVRLAPDGNIRHILFHVLGQAFHVILPVGRALNVQVLLEDAGPLLAADVLVNLAYGCTAIHRCEVQLGREFDVGVELLVGFVVAVVERTTLILDDSRESVQVGGGSGSGNLGTETVTTNRRHRDLLFVHPPDDVGGDAIHVERIMMVRLALITVVEKPDVAHVANLVLALSEERLEVLCRLSDLWKPNHGWQVRLATLHERTLKSNLITSRSNSCLYTHS